MDLDFSRRGRARKGAVPLPLDYARLVAGIAATQAGSRTAAIEARLSAARPVPGGTQLDALVTVFEARSGWLAGVTALGGSFHPGLTPETPARSGKA